MFVTVLGFVLQGNPSAQSSVLHSTLSQFPIIGTQLQNNVALAERQRRSALAIGLFGSLFAGLGITGATQNAFNQVWYVPHKHRPNFLNARLRGLGLLVMLGCSRSSPPSPPASSPRASEARRRSSRGVLIAFVVNLLLFFTAFRFLTSIEVETATCSPA